MDLETLVRRHGTDSLGLELYHEKSTETSFFCLNGSITSKESREFEGFGIRVCDRDGRVGFSYCQSESQLAAAIRRAAGMVGHSPGCLGYSFPQAGKYPSSPSWLDSEAREIGCLQPSGAMGMFNDFISSCQEGGTIALEGGFSVESHEHSIANSNGLFASSAGGSLSASMQTKFNDNSAYAMHSSQRLGDFAAGSIEEGRKSSLLAREIADARALPSGKYDLLFELPALHSLLSEILLPSFDGDSILSKSSMLAGRAGERMFSESFTLLDDPADLRGFFAAFDGEGVPSSGKRLVENGAVSGFLLDSRAACLLGKDACGGIGNCARNSFQSMPSCGESNLVVSASGGAADMAGEYIEIHSFHGTHTANTTTGDFSVISDLAFWCNPKSPAGGERVPVKNVMISGNAFRLFNAFSPVGGNQGRFLNLISPRIMFEGVEIVGST
ncbi:MAG: TldD/PmbA family protein [Candidatus Micrarchaeia archaeon]